MSETAPDAGSGRALAWLFIVLLGLGGGVWMLLREPDRTDRRAGAEDPDPVEGTIGRFPRSQFHIDHDRFLPATDPELVPAADARFLEDGDEVFGLVLVGHARAYPTRMLSYHHVVNDQIHGIPVAVTY